MKVPNLFKFAASELSQDAFICWFLSWAEPTLKTEDQSLHNCATSFLQEVFFKHSVEFPEVINSIEVKRQVQNIDVLCVVNKQYALIFEDKTHTKQHSNQLATYKQRMLDRSFKESDILPIYYKTEDQSDLSPVIKNGYQPFLRQEIILVLNEYIGNNQILIDYREHLQRIQCSVESYKTLELEKWTRRSWIGFYQALKQHLQKGNWKYVANPSGRFLGFSWHKYSEKKQKYFFTVRTEKALL